MADLLDLLSERVLLCDGGMGSLVQAADLDAETDYGGHENCTDILTRTRPDLIRSIHRAYLDAGADMVITNTFGGSPVTLGEFGLSDIAHDLCAEAAQLAREAIAQVANDGRPRFVLGDIGPGTKLPSLGHLDYAAAKQAFAIQAAGLIAGGVDGLLVETCQDPLQIKAAVNGAKQARQAAGKSATQVPILVQVTVEATGTLLVGSDIAAAATVIDALDVPLLGLNCATGPQEMAEHVRWLGENWRGKISVQPNAGLPELVDGKTVYPLRPDDLALWLERFLEEDRVNLIGGCCGTTPEHIAALDQMLRRRAAPGQWRPALAPRTPGAHQAVASLYSAVELRQENAVFAIGERCNANGSKKFRDLLAAEDWDACVAMARQQVREGSHAIDVCAAYVGRDECADMRALVSALRGAVTAPLVIDSTELPVLETALELYGGKAIINSINFEDGEEPAAQRLALAREHGAAVIALTIDEQGMAKTATHKLAIAKRLYDFAVNQHGLPAHDLLFDPLTFTICTGNSDDRRLAIETLDAIEMIAREMPSCQIALGLSNVSFGLKPAARHVLNSVFLDHAVRRGMNGAIIHVAKIAPLHSIPEAELAVAEDLIFDRRGTAGQASQAGTDYDPLGTFLSLFEGRDARQASAVKVRPTTVEECLKQRIIDGDSQGLAEDLEQARERYAPIEIINTLLLDGMKVVGELFGSGKMQLPFVLKSAETMKAAVALLEPHMEKVAGQEKGTIVLATVKGDVHDIGKNLVDIILTNNGYRVVNLGIKQPIADILAAVREYQPHAVGLSGLLVKSTVIMRENLEEMTRQDFDLPVLLGGAALTRKYVEEDCVAAYGSGRVAYARDAFDGLRMMDKAVAGQFDQLVHDAASRRAQRPSSKKPAPTEAPAEDPTSPATRPVDLTETRVRRNQLTADVTPPQPPFWGARLIEQVSLNSLLPFLNETMLFQFHWGFKKAGRNRAEFAKWLAAEVRPILHRLLETCQREDILAPQAAYGFWKAAGEGNDLILFAPDGQTPVARFPFPRQARPDGLCIADYFRDVSDAQRDVVALQVVTVGQRASEVARQWFQDNRYQDYLYLHGLSVEMAEALAEYVHKRIRAELGFGHQDARDMAKLIKQGYRGARYSFGYPACPHMADQHTLLALLGAERIGLRMDESDQLHPEQSTAALVVHHPQAGYFVI